MPGHEDEPASPLDRVFDDLEIRPLEQVEHGIPSEPRQDGGLDRRAPEMLVRAPSDAPDAALVEARERRGDLPFDDLPADAEGAVAERANSRPDVPGDAPVQGPERCHERAERRVLGLVGEADVVRHRRG